MTRLPATILTLVLAFSVLLPGQTRKPGDVKLPSWVRVTANIAYDQYPQTVVDILEPGKAALGARPGVLVIHGGGWVQGSKEEVVSRYCLPYLKRGFVVCNVEYRLAGAALAPAAVADVLKAAEWFRENAGRFRVAPDRIIATGSSAGGHLALMAGLAPEYAGLGPETKLAAVVNWYGITDVADQVQGANLRHYAEQWIPPREGRLELARQVSPITYVRDGVPPVLTIHGDADLTVPYEHGVRLTDSLREQKADAELITVRGGGHGGFGDKQMKKLHSQIFKFLRKRKIIQ